MQRRIDDPTSSDRIDTIVSYRIDTNPLDLIDPQRTLGTITRPNTLVTSVTSTRSLSTQITA